MKIRFRALICILSLMLSAIVFSNFVSTMCLITENYVISEKYKDTVIYTDDSFIVKDCYKYGREEQIEILKTAVSYLRNEGIEVKRSLNNMEAELYFHKRMYELGVLKDHAVDAEIEYKKDDRFLVRSAVILYELLGI